LLPDPTILSNQIVPSVSRMEQGWLQRVGSKELNDALVGAQTLVLNDAISSGILEDAKMKARDAIAQLMWPFRADPRNSYAIKILIGTNRRLNLG
jgi:hypothetical protein